MATRTRASTSSAPPRPARKTKAAAAKAASSTQAKAPSKKAAPPAKTARPEPAPKAERIKLLRDSFTIPASEYELIAVIKQRAVSLQHPAKKSEVLRAGLKVLAAMDEAALRAALEAVPAVKTGRPKGDGAAPAEAAPSSAKKKSKK